MGLPANRRNLVSVVATAKIGKGRFRFDDLVSFSSASQLKPLVNNFNKSESAPDYSQEEDVHLGVAHQMYKAGNYKQALEHCNAVYESNPLHLYYQLCDFEMCIAKNEEALRIEPHFGECYGNIANAWKRNILLRNGSTKEAEISRLQVVAAWAMARELT